MTRQRLATFVVCAVFLVGLLCLFGGQTPAQANVPEPAGADAPPAAVWAVPAAPAACAAQPTRYKSTLSATQDSYINSASADTNYGTATSLRVGRFTVPTAGSYRTLVAFDLSSLPADAVIVTATLELYQTSGSGFSVAAETITSTWSETGVTWNNQPGADTQNKMSGALSGNWYRWNITPVAQQWYAGTLANNGILLVFDIGTINTRNFSSREGGNSPRLVIEYRRRVTLPLQADTFVSEANPSTIYGSYDTLSVGRNESTLKELHGLLQFDLSGVPADATIISATLGLYPYFALAQAPAQAQAALTVASEAIQSSWGEMTVNWSNAPASVDMGDPPSAVVIGNWTWWDVTRLVQSWQSGTSLNYGVLLRPAPGVTGTATFDAMPKSTHATLIVTYGPPPCYAVSAATISGVTKGVTDTQYTFVAGITPPTATIPITYTWQATDQPPHSGPQEDIEYTWATPGWKTITLTVENCESSIVATHLVSITAPLSGCVPLTGLGLNGPSTGITGTVYVFTATAVPSTATQPITFTWQVANQSPRVAAGGPSSVVSYTWNTPGPQAITITVQNCGGEMVQHAAINIWPRSYLPDLVVSGLWYEVEQERLGYLVKNLGGSVAPAGHRLDVTQSITLFAQVTYPEDLAPGAIRAGYINIPWTCPGPNWDAARVTACADSGQSLDEKNEANNCIEDWWACDMTPPRFTSGPTVISITEHTAAIVWETDEPARSEVNYSQHGYLFGDPIINTSYRVSHKVELSGLEPGRTYLYQIWIKDETWNVANTTGLYFETRPVGTDPAQVTSFGMVEYPSDMYEFYTLQATLAAPAGADRVSFFLDGQLVGKDYSPAGNLYEVYVSPAALGLTRANWFKPHALQVQAYNLENEVTAVQKSVTPASRPMTAQAVLVSPDPGKKIYFDGVTAPAGTSVNSLVYAAEYRWKCTDSGFSEGGVAPPGQQAVRCDTVRQSVSQMRLLLNGQQVGSHTPAAGAHNHIFNLDLSGKGSGTHTIRFEADTSDGQTFSAETEIELIQGKPELELSRQVTRNHNVFEVTLTLENKGTGIAYVDYIKDYVQGFQVIETSTAQGLQTSAINSPASNYYYVKSDDGGDQPKRQIMIDLFTESADKIPLGAGESFVINYTLAPVMYQEFEYYYIGASPDPNDGSYVRYQSSQGTSTRLYRASGNSVNDPAGYASPMPLQQDVVMAVAETDYILVTSPAGLADLTMDIDWRTCQGTQRELNILLSRMAELAALKNGVLGFLPASPCRDTLDALLQPGGMWADAMHPNFRRSDASGYVLLVGEQEIIPAYPGNYGVNFSDLTYASTSGDGKPELIVGRIVGNDLGTLRKALDTSLSFHRSGLGFDRSHAIGVSGRGRGESTFWGDIKAAADYLVDGGFQVTKIRWKTDNNPTAWDVFKNAVAATHPDVIAYSGHGNPDGWYALYSGDVPLLNFGATRPIGAGFACSTGNYEDPGGDDYSLPEAWLRWGGSIYIGSSDTSYDYPDSDAIRGFFSRWESGEKGRNIGQVYTYLKRDKWGIDSDWRMFAHEYHLFGDPKFGAMPAQAQVIAAAPRATQVITALQVHIPAFQVISATDEITTTDALDAVEIPGGEIWTQEGDYRVPYWSVSLDYPPGQRVQNVVLTEQAGLVVTTGLNIPTSTVVVRCPACSSGIRAAAAVSNSHWFPNFEQPYRWQVVDNADGSSTLELVIYPFYYNPETTDARFYREWSFDVDVVAASADILSLANSQAVYPLGGAVSATLSVNGAGAAQDIVVNAVVKDGFDAVVAGLPLQTLRALTGTALLDLEWDSAGFAAGNYAIEVRLVDMQGNVLDSELDEFTLGVAAAEVTSLTAAPQYFTPGGAIDISTGVRNSGDAPISGTVIIRVQPADGMTTTATFTHTVTNLAPNGALTFDDAWNTTGAGAGDYRILAYVKYAVQASAPRQVNVSTRTSLYLPLVVKNH